MVVAGPGLRPGQLCDPAVKVDSHQLDAVADSGRVEHVATIGGPDRNIAALAVKVRVCQRLDHATIPATISKLLQPGTILPDDMRVTIVVLTGNEQQPFAVRRPLRHEIEGIAGFDLPLVAAVRVRDKDLIVFVVTDPCPVRRCGVAIGKTATVTRDIALVATV